MSEFVSSICTPVMTAEYLFGKKTLIDFIGGSNMVSKTDHFNSFGLNDGIFPFNL